MAGARPSRGTGWEVCLQSVPSSEIDFFGLQPGGEFEEQKGTGSSLRKEEDSAGNLKQNFTGNAELGSLLQSSDKTN